MKRKRIYKLLVIISWLIALPIILSGCIGGTGAGCGCSAGSGFDLIGFLRNPYVMVIGVLLLLYWWFKSKK